MGKYGELKLLNNTCPASGVNAQGSNDIPSENVGLECRMQYAGYIDSTNEKGTNLILRPTPKK
jgi:hypothetical protein